MTTNEVLISLHYILNVSDSKLVDLLESVDYVVLKEEIVSYLKREDEPGYVRCPDEVLAHFLNALVIYKRGRDDSRSPAPVEIPVTNNTVLKRIRIAFQLKDVDLIALIEKQGTLKVTKSELSAFFRARDHRNYRECGDQYLRNLFKALSL